jgi:hypothetical protein
MRQKRRFAVRRHRTIAGAPARTATAAWQAIASLIGDTLERSSSIDRGDVDAALEPIAQLARMLISAGHLQERPLILVAGEVWVEISTISGGAALALEENLNPVPGGADATDWTLHVPQVEPMAKLVRAAVKGRPHLSGEAPTETAREAAKASPGVDLEALALWAEETP